MKLRYLLPSFAVLAVSAHAADVTLTASDGFGASSFNAAGRWSNTAAPAPGNNYFTGEFMLRTPTTVPSAPFAGDSLTIAPTSFDLNKSLMLKGPGYTVDINNLTVDGGYIRHAEGDPQSFVLAGNLAIGINGARFNLQGPVDVSSLVSGSGAIIIDASVTDARTLTLSNESNAFTGDIINNGRFQLSSTGRLNFVVGTSGVNNSISGPGPKTNLNGSFFIDLSGASSNDGDSWNLITATNRLVLLSGVSSAGGEWTLDGTSWTDPSGTYRFSETSGVLRVIPSDADTDNDNDLYTQLEELDAGTDPDDVFSSPDSDTDGLADGFEVFYFGDHLTGATFTVWTSPDLASWTEDNGAAQSVASTVGEIETVEITLSAGLTNNSKLFVRIEANP